MRKTSYVVTFFAVALTLTLNIISAQRPGWIVVSSPEILRRKVTFYYGLSERCERDIIRLPKPSDDSELEYTSYTCRPFPTSTADSCQDENRLFCTVWTSAGYISQLAIGFAAVSLLSILIGLTTHSRRRRIWRAVAGLTFLHAACQIGTFAAVTEMYRSDRFPTFEQGRPGWAYIFNVLSWVLGIITTFAVVTTGISADKGHRWAAGNRAYQPISG
ncbi:hypothetical protein PLEOSDRAFT_158512 [Pleurotus ostreatus PC15]|uniref:Uncharacterized protein n=1 Tax=Pleurotus ostreatus (strain PC15) TaxID=1137138 RepID=A0A067NKQ3_PLEO1|nr:hypothetical protein PLEOSDRAFT_158512 [Pleurotus ostreatus PC15]